MATITLPPDRQFFTVEEALELISEASTCPLTVVDVFVEVTTDDNGREHHPAGGRVAVEQPRLSDRGLIALYLATEAFPAACKELGILPRDPMTGLAGAYSGTRAQNEEYTITAAELARYAESRGIKIATALADAEPVPEEAHQAEAGVRTDGLVAWQAVMLESWPAIVRAHGGKATARNAMPWLKRHGPRDVFPVEQPDRGALAWLDLAGNPQTVSLKTIQNLFPRWKAGKILA